jgi:hypothetical protein
MLKYINKIRELNIGDIILYDNYLKNDNNHEVEYNYNYDFIYKINDTFNTNINHNIEILCSVDNNTFIDTFYIGPLKYIFITSESTFLTHNILLIPVIKNMSIIYDYANKLINKTKENLLLCGCKISNYYNITFRCSMDEMYEEICDKILYDIINHFGVDAESV